MSWFIWGTLLILQNFASCVNSRAKNSDNLWYTTVTAVVSNAVWIASNFFMVDKLVVVMKHGSAKEVVVLGIFYTTCTVFGTLTSQWWAMNVLEKRWRV